MKPLAKVRACLALNVILMAVVLSCICLFATDESTYFRVGPHDDFVFVSVRLDTVSRYVIMLVTIAVMNCVKVVVAELGEPVLVFNVYNPDKRVITDFSRRQLAYYANSMFFLSNVRRVLEVMVTVTQADIALFSVVVEQFVSMATVCFLISENRFEPAAALEAADKTGPHYAEACAHLSAGDGGDGC